MLNPIQFLAKRSVHSDGQALRAEVARWRCFTGRLGLV
ncbi:hypothetical protein BLL52_0806 [Rhodoferax antarcticus ANT.BR]|uniref:Uncharacterized protein n=1 Tax=Rhodoferax antarcticus ANT.BR TaxID=1111071 RepID=A0A1Q8YIH9_9BURK|nr:hypothetical protein BLL52_0806 [Rhodoferax antarcticus ANT.BR]